MTEVRVAPWEDIDIAYRKFKRAVTSAGIIMDVKRKRYYYKPSDLLRKKQRANRKRLRKELKLLGEL